MRNILAFLCVLVAAAPARGAENSLEFGKFGKVAVYRPAKVEKVAIFISGDGGWNTATLPNFPNSRELSAPRAGAAAARTQRKARILLILKPLL